MGFRFDGGWLYSPRSDLLMLCIPFALALLAAAVANNLAEPSSVQPMAVWTAQYILGNGTHVVLTFLIFAVRPEALRAAPKQGAWVVFGAVAATVLAFSLFSLGRFDERAGMLVTGVFFNVFGLHHVLSQCRGMWALYALRGRQGQAAPPSAREIRLQRALTPMALALVLTRLFFVPVSSGTPHEAYLDAGQSTLLPFYWLGILVALWLGYCAAVARELLTSADRSGPKALYLLAVGAGVLLTLVTPQWGNVVLPGLHGLEYFVLSAHMLQPRDVDEARRFSGRHSWLLMAASMLPLFAIGVVGAVPALHTVATSVPWAVFGTLGTACVLAHYWADALIYRFRIPSVRQVMLRRMGFAA
jgi:hypothetical protein